MDWTGDLDEGEQAKRHKQVEFYSKNCAIQDWWILSYTRLVDIELYKTGGY